MKGFCNGLALAVAGLAFAVHSGAEAASADRPLTVVIFGGHPDDPESGAGGLAALLTRGGHRVILAYGTAFRGDRRFFDRPEAEVRRAEASAACKVLGASPKFFPYAHEALTADRETVQAVAAWLDTVKPDIVVTHWPLDTHPNHHTVSSLVWQCYARRGGWNLYFFEVMTDQQTVAFEPELYLDIAPVLDLKKSALAMHKSQDPEAIWAVHARMHSRRGVECGITAAEAYRLVEAKDGCATLPVTFLARKAAAPRATARPDAPATTISAAVRDEDGFLTHTVQSEYQTGPVSIRVLLPDQRERGERFPVVYVLPVEAGRECRYGDGLLEVRRNDLHNALRAIFVAPTFSDLPWYADGAHRPELRQETYIVKVVVPWIDHEYPVRGSRDGRLLLGFSKSGWGAYSLLLRHPKLFGKAAAWDAPLAMARPERFGMRSIFETQENFEKYKITTLLERQAKILQGERRLILLGYGNFRDQHEQAHALMVELKIPHVYEDGPPRTHEWSSGWLPEAARLLLSDGLSIR